MGQFRFVEERKRDVGDWKKPLLVQNSLLRHIILSRGERGGGSWNNRSDAAPSVGRWVKECRVGVVMVECDYKQIQVISLRCLLESTSIEIVCQERVWNSQGRALEIVGCKRKGAMAQIFF